MNVKGQKVEYDMLFITTCPEDVQHVGCINVICIELSRTDFLSHVRLDYSNRGKKLPILPQGNHPCRFIELFFEISGLGILSLLFIFSLKSLPGTIKSKDSHFLTFFFITTVTFHRKPIHFLYPEKDQKTVPLA